MSVLTDNGIPDGWRTSYSKAHAEARPIRLMHNSSRMWNLEKVLPDDFSGTAGVEHRTSRIDPERLLGRPLKAKEDLASNAAVPL